MIGGQSIPPLKKTRNPIVTMLYTVLTYTPNPDGSWATFSSLVWSCKNSGFPRVALLVTLLLLPFYSTTMQQRRMRFHCTVATCHTMWLKRMDRDSKQGEICKTRLAFAFFWYIQKKSADKGVLFVISVKLYLF